MRAVSESVLFDFRAVRAALRYASGLSVALALSGVLVLSFLVFDGHDNQRLLQLAFFFVFALTSLVHGRSALSFTGPRFTAICWWALGFFLLGAVSSGQAFSPRHAFYEVASFLMLLMLGLRIACEIAHDGARSTALVITACGLGCALYAFKVAVVYVSALYVGAQPDAGMFTPGFSNIRFLNHAQTVTLPLLVLLCVLSKPGEKTRWMWFSVAAFWWTLLLVTAGRGTVVGLMAGSAAALVLRRGHAAAFCKAMLLTGLAGVAIYVVFFAIVPTAIGFRPFGELFHVVSRSIADPTSLRGLIWWRALELIIAHPWLGVGPLHFAHFGSDVRTGAHPHNWILQIASEWGLPALLCLCLATGLAILGLLRTAALIPADDVRNHNILVAWIATGTAILVDGLFSGLFVMPVSQLLITLYIGCAAGWAMSFRPQSVRLEPASVLRHAIVKVLLLLSILGMANGVRPEIAQRISSEDFTKEEAALNLDTHWPRIWRAGFF
jgi:putative inorganic carbon (HCO3(-)) transporter